MVNFDPDPADLALSSVPGQEVFDPRRHRFSEEELKPQPMIKKARKMLVPDEQKVVRMTLMCVYRGVQNSENHTGICHLKSEISSELGSVQYGMCRSISVQM